MASVISRNRTAAELLVVGDQKLQLDRDGNLENLADWSEQVAELLARQVGVELTPGHWEILYLVREFHERRGLSPVMRILVKLVENALGPDKGNSLYLLQLFPGSPARLACRIAGLPRPSNCL
jgi:tRNA 2-thiouridine synthesizing protein E